MFVKKYMTTDPVTIFPDVLILDAFRILKERDFRHLPVTDSSGRLEGMVTDRDIRSALPSSVASADERERIMQRVKDTAVTEIMSTDLNTLHMDSTLDDALILLMKSNVGAVPVIDSEKVLQGIFSIRDLMRAYGSLFGLGEKGSVMITVRAGEGKNVIRDVAEVLAEHGVTLTRVVREEAEDGKGAYLHLRVNTINQRAVNAALREAGIEIVVAG
jgi:acetoin utilization protein AcuB